MKSFRVLMVVAMLALSLLAAIPASADGHIAGTYTVVAGDTLWNIANAQLGDGDRYLEIVELTNADERGR